MRREAYIGYVARHATPLTQAIEAVLSNFDTHFSQYVKYFSSKTRSVSEAARDYLYGLFQSSKSNIERMSEVVAKSAYHRMHHMLSDAPWDCTEVASGLAQDANAHRLGSRQSGLLIDGSGFAKQGEKSAADTVLHELARMQGLRFFVEQAFKEAKSACGMAEYQCRKWDGWHHHMAMVMIATMFLAKERLALRDTVQLLSCEDVVQMIKHRLPSKIGDDDDLVSQITSRHQRRIAAMHSAYQRQRKELASMGDG